MNSPIRWSHTLAVMTLVSCATPTSTHEPSGSADQTKEAPEGVEAHSGAPIVGAAPVLSDDTAAYQDFNLKGCPFLSIQRQAVACWDSELDMGFGSVSLQFFDLNAQEAGEVFHLYGRLDDDDDFIIRPDAIASARAALAEGGFMQIPVEAVRDPALVDLRMNPDISATARVRSAFESPEVALPSLTGDSGFPGVSIEQARRCCHWSWRAESYQDTVAALVTFTGSCDFVREEGDPCYTEDISDETSPYGHVQVLIRLR